MSNLTERYNNSINQRVNGKNNVDLSVEIAGIKMKNQ